jgi:RHH-type rel operon transcriptional repressor/antitoxin RelB
MLAALAEAGTVDERKKVMAVTVDSGTSVVRISKVLDERLDLLAKKTGRRKSYYASKAIAEYLEDREDYLLGLAAYEESKGKRTYTLDEVFTELGLERRAKSKGAQRNQKARSARPRTRR